MQPMRILSLLLVAAIISLAASRGGKVKYVGGTLGQLAESPKGRIHTTNEEYLVFESSGNDYVTVFWQRINLLEYGQKVGRRVIMAIIISPLLLLSQSREHYVTIGFTDEHSGQQVMVFRVDKNDIRSLLASLEVRTNLVVQYQDEEARQAGKGN